MKRVICKLPNASDRISGYAFEARDGAMLSEELPADVAEMFATIPGYEIVADKAPERAEPAAEKTEAKRPRGRATIKSDE